MVLLFFAWKYLTNIAFKFKQKAFPIGRAEINKQLKELGQISYEEKLVTRVFAFTALAWISRSYLLTPIVPGIDDTIIGLISTLIVFLLPTKNKKKQLLIWEEAVKLP